MCKVERQQRPDEQSRREREKVVDEKKEGELGSGDRKGKESKNSRSGANQQSMEKAIHTGSAFPSSPMHRLPAVHLLAASIESDPAVRIGPKPWHLSMGSSHGVLPDRHTGGADKEFSIGVEGVSGASGLGEEKTAYEREDVLDRSVITQLEILARRKIERCHDHWSSPEIFPGQESTPVGWKKRRIHPFWRMMWQQREEDRTQ
jgi:hypothetical protein